MTTLIIILAIIATVSLVVVAGTTIYNTFVPVPGLTITEVAGQVGETAPADPVQEQLNALSERLDHLTELLMAVLESGKIDDGEGDRQEFPPAAQVPKAVKATPSGRRMAAPSRKGTARRKPKAPAEVAPA